MSWRHHDAIARASTRIEFQEDIPQAWFSSSPWKVSEPYNTKIIYKFIVDARAAARSEKNLKISIVAFNTLFNIIRVCRSRYVLYILLKKN